MIPPAPPIHAQSRLSQASTIAFAAQETPKTTVETLRNRPMGIKIPISYFVRRPSDVVDHQFRRSSGLGSESYIFADTLHQPWNMLMHNDQRTCWAAILLLVVALPRFALVAQDETARPVAEPELSFIYPLGGSPGTTVEAYIEGRELDGAHTVWFSQEGLRASVKKVEDVDRNDSVDGETPVVNSPRYQRVTIEVEITDTVQAAVHRLRLVTHGGISNPLPFLINSGPVIDEAKGRMAHSTPDQAQQVQFPMTINGKLSEVGELDFYAFDVSKGKKLAFEVFTVAPDFRPTLTLYQSDGSWLNPHKPSRLDFGQQPQAKKRWTYQFDGAGRYYLRIGSRYGRSSPNFIYQLKIDFADQTALYETWLTRLRQDDWQERSFTRQLELDRMEQLWSRTGSRPALTVETVRTDVSVDHRDSIDTQPGAESTIGLTGIDEQEPNGQPVEANVLELPVLINGTIEQPGDIDIYRFHVSAGQRLVFEIQTLQVAPPRFNLVLEILDSDGREFLTNQHKKIALTSQDPLSYLAILKLHLADRDDCGLHSISYLKTLEPKMMVTFDTAAEYYLRVSDLSPQSGHSSHDYRIVIRPQVPHVGEIKVNQDRLNLVPGGARKLTVVTGQEENFSGEIAVLVDGLPSGVKAYTATEVKPRKPLGHPSEREECFIPSTQTATIVLLADQDAPLTPVPVWIHLGACPVVEGTPGPVLSIREIPLMIVNSTQPILDAKVSTNNVPNVPN